MADNRVIQYPGQTTHRSSITLVVYTQNCIHNNTNVLISICLLKRRFTDLPHHITKLTPMHILRRYGEYIFSSKIEVLLCFKYYCWEIVIRFQGAIKNVWLINHFNFNFALYLSYKELTHHSSFRPFPQSCPFTTPFLSSSVFYLSIYLSVPNWRPIPTRILYQQK